MTDEPLKGSQYVLYDFIFHHQPVTISLFELSSSTGYAVETVRQALVALRCAGMIQARPKTKRGPFIYEVRR
jgi:hypothetical protein